MPGDLVVNKYQAHAGGFGAAVERGLVTPNYTVFKTTRALVTGYYAALFGSLPYRELFEVESRGVGDGMAPLYNGAFYRTPVLVPPLDEQAAIVRFLDHADRRIRRYIRLKQKLIKLLEEQKQAIVHQAVTRGLDPGVPMKDSGVPLLGAVPAHWEVKRLAALASVRQERNPGNLGLLSVFLDRGVIPYGEGGGQVHAPSMDLSRYQVVRRGDFVLNNQQAWRGSVGVSAHDGIISPAYVVLALGPSLDSGFANVLLRSRVLVDQFVVASRGVGDIQRQVYWPYLRSVAVSVPPMGEQRDISRHLADETARLSQAEHVLRREVALLRELRTRLIADVVTGQLDVRAAAAALPEMPEEDEPFDDLDEPAEAEPEEDADAEVAEDDAT